MDLRFHVIIRQNLFDMIPVDTHRLCPQPDLPPVHLNDLGHLIDTQRTTIGQELIGDIYFFDHFKRRMTADHIHKILHITWDMKSDKITEQQAADDLLAPGNNIKNICCRKCRMVKKANFQIGTHGL
ncbi:hypothetical protein D3C80_865540 [compost metagenome]